MQEHTEKSTSRYATIDGVKLHYNDAGEGEPLILLHGGGPGASGWSNFKQNVPELSRHYRVLLVDQPGYGKSDKVIPEKEARSELASRLIVGLLDQLKIEKAHVLGNSFGGRTAINLALRWPERVSRLILMGPAGGSLSIYSPEPTEGMKHLHGFFAAPGPSVEKMRNLVKTFMFDASKVTETLIEERYAAATEPETRKFYEHFLSKPDSREPQVWREIDKIAHRTLLVWGRDDRANPFEGGLFMLKRMQDARLHIFPRCGHWAQLEHCDEFNGVLSTFLGAT
nr:C558 [uncultured bacterium]